MAPLPKKIKRTPQPFMRHVCIFVFSLVFMLGGVMASFGLFRDTDAGQVHATAVNISHYDNYLMRAAHTSSLFRSDGTIRTAVALALIRELDGVDWYDRSNPPAFHGSNSSYSQYTPVNRRNRAAARGTPAHTFSTAQDFSDAMLRNMRADG